MDEFPHITVEHKVLKRRVQFKFNPERCRLAGLKETPNADKYEVIKLRRVYHFNKDTSDHVVLTIPKPVFVVVDKHHIPEENSSEINHNGGYATERETAYQNVKNNSKSEKYSCDNSEDVVIIEKCVPEVVAESNKHKKQTEANNNISEIFCDESQPKSTIICDEYKSKIQISELDNVVLNNQEDYININGSKEKPINGAKQPSNIAVDLEVQKNPTDFIPDNIQPNNNNKILLIEELTRVPQTNNKTVGDKSNPLSVSDELSINQKILTENSLQNSNVQDVIGISSEITINTDLVSENVQSNNNKILPIEELTQAPLTNNKTVGVRDKSNTLSDFNELSIKHQFLTEIPVKSSNVQDIIFGIISEITKNTDNVPDNIQFNNNKIITLELNPQINSKIVDNKSDTSSIFEKLSINEQILNENSQEKSNIQDVIFGNPSEITKNTDLVPDNIRSNNNKILPIVELIQAPQTNNEIVEDKSNTSSVFDELSINEQILNENSNNRDIIFGISSEIFEPITIQEISVTDEILWTELYQSNAEGVVLSEKHPEFYQEDLSVVNPVEEEMRKIHGEYIVQEHSYVQPLISEEDMEFACGGNFSVLDMFKIQEPVVEEDFQIIQPVDEPFEMQPLALDEENDKELGSEIRKFIVSQEHSYGSVKGRAPITVTQDNFDCFSTIEEPCNSYSFNVCSEIQEPIMQEKLTELRKVQEANNLYESSVAQSVAVEVDEIQETVVDENTRILDKYEEPITSWENFEIQRNVNVEMGKIFKELLVGKSVKCSEKEVKIMEKQVQDLNKIEFKDVEESTQNSVQKEPENLKKSIRISVIVKPKNLEKIVPNSIQPEVTNLDLVEKRKTLEQLVVIKPVQAIFNEKQPKCLENTILDGSNEKVPISLQQPIQDGLIAEEPQPLEKPSQANINERHLKPLQNSIRDDVIEKRSKTVEQSIQDGPIAKKPQILEKHVRFNLNEGRPKFSKDPIQDICIKKDTKILKQSIQDGPIAKEPPILEKPVQTNLLKNVLRGDFIEKGVKILEQHIIKEAYILVKPIQANLNERQPKVQADSIEKDQKILERAIQGGPIAKEPQILKKPIQDSIAEEPHFMVKPFQANLNKGHPKVLNRCIQDLIVKKPQIMVKPIQPNFNERRPVFFENIRDFIIESRFKILDKFNQNSPIANETKTLEKSDSNSFIHKDPKILEKSIRNISIDKGPRIMEKPVQDTFTKKDPEILQKPIQARISKEQNFLEKHKPSIEKKNRCLEKPVANLIKNFKNLEATSDKKSKMLEKLLLGTIEKVPVRCSIEQKPKIFQKPRSNILEETLLNTSEKKLKILTNPVDSNRRNMAEKCTKGSKNILVRNTTKRKQKIQKMSFLSSHEINPKIAENTIEGEGRNMGEKCFEDTIKKMPDQYPIEQEPSSLEKDSVIIKNSSDNNEHNVVEKNLHDTVAKVSNQNFLKQKPIILGNVLLHSIEGNGNKPVEECFDGTTTKMPLEGKPKIVKKSLSNSHEKRPKIIENPIQCKKRKIVKESLKNTVDKVPKIQEKALQGVSKTVGPPIQTVIGNEPNILESFFESASENEFDDILEEPLQDTIEKVLEILDKSIGSKAVPVENPQHKIGKQLDVFNQASIIVEEPITDIFEKVQKILEDPLQDHSEQEPNILENSIQNQPQSPEKLIQDVISKDTYTCSVLSPVTFDDQDVFEEEMDYADPPVLTPEIPNFQDPLEEEMRRIHEDSNIQENEIPKENSSSEEPIKKPPVFIEPASKKPRTDYPEEEELDFRGFTREEQIRARGFKSKRDSSVSAIESVHETSICSTLIGELKGNTVNNLIKRKQLSGKVRVRGPYKCNKCDFRTNKQSHLKVHLRAHVQPFWCNLCLEMFPNIEDLQYHVKAYHDVDKNNCKSAKDKSSNVKFDEIATLERNLRNSRTGEKLFNKPDKQAFKCGFCNYSSSYMKRLQHHMNVHTREKLYSCDQCDYATLTKWMIDRHKNDHVKENQQYECDECGFITMYRDQLDEHLQLHSGQKVYKCDKCSFSTAHLGYFNAHVGFHQPKTECPSECGDDEEVRSKPQIAYTCRECGYYTGQQATVFRHARKAHQLKTSIKVFSNHSNKEIHMCTKCGYWAQSEVAFNRHLRIHTDIKPNKCELCDFVTDNEFNLKVHVTNHASEIPFKCTKCKRNCLTLERLKDHTVKVHNGDMGKLFPLNKNLQC